MQSACDAGTPYSDRTAEWLGTKCDTVSRRLPRVMNVDTSCRNSTASSGSGSGSSGSSSGYLVSARVCLQGRVKNRCNTKAAQLKPC